MYFLLQVKEQCFEYQTAYIYPLDSKYLLLTLPMCQQLVSGIKLEEAVQELCVFKFLTLVQSLPLPKIKTSQDKFGTRPYLETEFVFCGNNSKMLMNFQGDVAVWNRFQQHLGLAFTKRPSLLLRNHYYPKLDAERELRQLQLNS